MYRFLKGHNKLEKGASIAKKFNNTDEHVMFVLMIIRSKLLQNTNHSKETHQKDSETLHVLLKIIHDYHLKQQLLFYSELLEGMNDWYNTHINLSAHYLKIKAFDLYLDNLKNYLPHVNVIFKNLCQLLQLRNSDLEESMVKFFDVLKSDNKYCMSSLMLLDLHVSDTGIYSKDCDGMFVLNKSQIQRLFRNHTKSFAIK